MLRNLYRWLAAGQSALASAPLLAAVRSAMRKVVLQLVAEAGKLGATVVAADFSSVIIATGKHDLASAVGWAHLCWLHPRQAATKSTCFVLRPRTSPWIWHAQMAYTFCQTASSHMRCEVASFAVAPAAPE